MKRWILILSVLVSCNTGNAELIEELKNAEAYYNLPSDSLIVLATKESNLNMKAYRFEPKLYEKWKHKFPNNKKRMALVTSHCALQVLGVHAKKKNLKPRKLYNIKTCVSVGAELFSKHYKRCVKTKNSYKSALQCAAYKYNGAGEMARRYSKDFIKRYEQRNL